MNSEIHKASEIVQQYFSNLDNEIQKTNFVSNAWQEVLKSINSDRNSNTYMDYGSQLADHSKIIDLKNGILFIETDHPGRIQLFQTYRSYILNGLHKKVPQLEIKTLSIKLSNGNTKKEEKIFSSSDMEKIIEQREKALLEYEKKVQKKTVEDTTQKKELPENLKSIFDNLKKEIENDD